MSLRRTGPERGSVLIVIMIFAIVIAGFATTGVWRTWQETQAGTSRRSAVRSEAAVRALMAEAEMALRMSPTDPDGANQLLTDVCSLGATRTLAAGTDAVNEISGSDYRLLHSNSLGNVWVTRLTGDYYRLEAEATVGAYTTFLSRTFLQRSPASAFQRYVAGVGAFPADSNLMLGQEPFRNGDTLRVTPVPEALTAAEAAARRSDIPPLAPLGSSGDQVPLAAYELPMPGDTLFDDLESAADSAYTFPPQEGYVVELLADTISVTEILPGGAMGAVQVLPLPADGILYAKADILSLEGTLNGRLTVVAEGTIHVTGSLQYVDAEGDLAMVGGEVSGPDYDPNPDYDGDSALGVVARESIYYAPAMPSSSEVNAALYSHTGTVGLQMFWYDGDVGLNESGFGAPIYYDDYTAQGKTSLKELGAKISAGMPSTLVEGTALGFAQTVSLYDGNLRDRATPGFPAFRVDLPILVRQVGGVEGLTPGGDRLTTRRESDRRPATADPARFAAVRAAVRENARLFGVDLGD